MVIHDGHVGQFPKTLDDMGFADNTIVVYTTDNGPNYFAGPEAAVWIVRTGPGATVSSHGQFLRHGLRGLAG